MGFPGRTPQQKKHWMSDLRLKAFRAFNVQDLANTPGSDRNDSNFTADLIACSGNEFGNIICNIIEFTWLRLIRHDVDCCGTCTLHMKPGLGRLCLLIVKTRQANQWGGPPTNLHLQSSKESQSALGNETWVENGTPACVSPTKFQCTSDQYIQDMFKPFQTFHATTPEAHPSSYQTLVHLCKDWNIMVPLVAPRKTNGRHILKHHV